MRPALPGVANLLAGWGPESDTQVADLYTFTLAGGEVLRYSGFQIGLQAPAPNSATPLLVFPLGPKFKRTRTKTQVGVEVDELELEIYAGAGDLIGTLTWQNALWAGLFDGAYCELDRAFVTPTLDVVGTITWFYGRVGDVDVGRTKITMKVKSLLDLLTRQMPKRLYQASCTFVFGDNMCLFNRASMAAQISAQAGSNSAAIKTTIAPNPSTLYDQGSIIGQSGQNNGFTRTIGKLQGGTIYYLKPFVYPVSPGDQFQLLPGCDHTPDTCQNVFNNLIHYGGFPYIPPPETAF